jgi:hypothetical protein
MSDKNKHDWPPSVLPETGCGGRFIVQGINYSGTDDSFRTAVANLKEIMCAETRK